MDFDDIHSDCPDLEPDQLQIRLIARLTWLTAECERLYDWYEPEPRHYWTVPCPVCKAEIGKICETIHPTSISPIAGNQVQYENTHKARKRLAIQAMENVPTEDPDDPCEGLRWQDFRAVVQEHALQVLRLRGKISELQAELQAARNLQEG